MNGMVSGVKLTGELSSELEAGFQPTESPLF